MNVLIGEGEDVTMNASITSYMPRMKRDGPLKIFPVPPGNITQTNAGNYHCALLSSNKPKIEENCFLQVLSDGTAASSWEVCWQFSPANTSYHCFVLSQLLTLHSDTSLTIWTLDTFPCQQCTAPATFGQIARIIILFADPPLSSSLSEETHKSLNDLQDKGKLF